MKSLSTPMRAVLALAIDRSRIQPGIVLSEARLLRADRATRATLDALVERKHLEDVHHSDGDLAGYRLTESGQHAARETNGDVDDSDDEPSDETSPEADPDDQRDAEIERGDR